MYEFSENSEEENQTDKYFIRKRTVPVRQCGDRFIFGERGQAKAGLPFVGTAKPESGSVQGLKKVQRSAVLPFDERAKKEQLMKQALSWNRNDIIGENNQVSQKWLRSLIQKKDIKTYDLLLQNREIKPQISKPMENQKELDVLNQIMYGRPLLKKEEKKQSKKEEIVPKKDEKDLSKKQKKQTKEQPPKSFEQVIGLKKMEKQSDKNEKVFDQILMLSSKMQNMMQQMQKQKRNNQQWREGLPASIRTQIDSSLRDNLTESNRQTAKEQRNIKNLIMSVAEQNAKSNERMDRLQGKMNEVVEGLALLCKRFSKGE